MPTEPTLPFDLFTEVNKIVASDKTKDMPPIPEAMTNFLGKLSLLEGVPMHNLVSDSRYLPLKSVGKKEIGSFKFFWVDPEWIESLLNGALSLAEEQDRLILENVMKGIYAAEVFYNESVDKEIKQIKGLEPKSFESELIARLLKNKGIKYGNSQPTTAQSNWCYSGFFIRSSIISSWTGVEIIAYGDEVVGGTATERLKIIRLERVAFDVLYCLCAGVINRVEIIQPPETIHFELSEEKKIFRKESARTLDLKAIVKLPFKEKIDPKPDSATLATMLLAAPFKTSLTINRDKINNPK